MATYLAHDALRLPAASLLANSGLCVNIEIKIWLLLGVNVDTAYLFYVVLLYSIVYTITNCQMSENLITSSRRCLA